MIRKPNVFGLKMPTIESIKMDVDIYALRIFTRVKNFWLLRNLKPDKLLINKCIGKFLVIFLFFGF